MIWRIDSLSACERRLGRDCGVGQLRRLRSTVRGAERMLSNLGRQHFHLGIDYGFPTASGPGRTPLLEIIERDMQEKRPSTRSSRAARSRVSGFVH
jgi:hypothetical protein